MIWGVLALLFTMVFSIAYYRHFLDTGYGPGRTAVIIDFPAGSSLNRISSDLEKKHLISSAFLFSLHARIEGTGGRIKAGTYRFTDAMPPREILRKLVAGDVYAIRFAVPEGYSIYQLAEMLDRRGIFKRDSFLSQCFGKPLLQELGIHGRSVEGYLYPSTYDIVPGMDESALIRMMVRKFRTTFESRFAEHADRSGMTLSRLLTLASMVEKEAVVPGERPVIASVFLNRLKRRMPLQSDPTAVYGIRAFSGRISRQDVLRKTPYNTYLIPGLPPGPIGNPGDGAIEAVLSPARTGFLYFVAKRDGTHYFSRTLAEHNRAVEQYLRHQ